MWEENVCVPENMLGLDVHSILRDIDPLEESPNHGIELYIVAKEKLTNAMQN